MTLENFVLTRCHECGMARCEFAHGAFGTQHDAMSVRRRKLVCSVDVYSLDEKIFYGAFVDRHDSTRERSLHRLFDDVEVGDREQLGDVDVLACETSANDIV